MQGKLEKDNELTGMQKKFVLQFFQMGEIKRLRRNQQKNPTPFQLSHKMVTLPSQARGKKILILDMDETLIHCKQTRVGPCDFRLGLHDPVNKKTIEIQVNARPYLQLFLQQVSQWFYVVIFTASSQNYADPILDHIDPRRQFIQLRLYRTSCLLNEFGLFVKDLLIFKGVPQQDILLVDNNIYSFMNQFANGIPIINFYDDKTDTELLDLLHYLRHLHSTRTDPRNYNYQYFFMDTLDKTPSIDIAIQSII